MILIFQKGNHLWNYFYKLPCELIDLWRGKDSERMTGRLNVLLPIRWCLEFEVGVKCLVWCEEVDVTLENHLLTFILDAICFRMFFNSENYKQYYFDCQILEQYIKVSH